MLSPEFPQESSQPSTPEVESTQYEQKTGTVDYDNPTVKVLDGKNNTRGKYPLFQVFLKFACMGPTATTQPGK